MEFAKLDHADVVVTAFVSSTPMSHDLGLVLDAVDRTGKLSGVRGRANHVAFWVDSREDVLRTADLYREAGLEIEYGPGKHGVGENLFLYVREPGGMRVELFSGGYMLYAPDIFPFEWKVSQGSLQCLDPVPWMRARNGKRSRRMKCCAWPEPPAPRRGISPVGRARGFG
jgi:catechol 2,3-dioxygenase